MSSLFADHLDLTSIIVSSVDWEQVCGWNMRNSSVISHVFFGSSGLYGSVLGCVGELVGAISRYRHSGHGLFGSSQP